MWKSNVEISFCPYISLTQQFPPKISSQISSEAIQLKRFSLEF